MRLYVELFFVTLLQGAVLTWCALYLGRSLRILDFPDKDRKRHARATPRTGGVAVFAALVLAVAEVCWQFAPQLADDPRAVRFAGFLLLSTALLCGLGLYDDKFGMRARNKFLWQIVAVVPFVLWGRSTTSADVFGWHLDFAWLAVPVMLFWLVSCTNFVNLVDGLDGLASSVGLIVSLTVAVLAWWNQVPEVSVLATILSGALAGFLVFNWPPARIFLGDSGSLPLGFLVGALALEAAAKKAAGLTLAVPVVLLSIPMFDTSMAILRRKLNGRKIGQGDRAHIHHCLRDRGFSPVQTLLWIGGLCAVTASAALLATVFNDDRIAVAVCLLELGLLVAGRIFGFNETVLLMRHVQAVALFLRSVPRVLRARFVVVRLQPTVSAGQLDLWQKIVKRAARLDCLEIEFTAVHLPTARQLAALAWTASHGETAESDLEVPVWRLDYAAPRGDGVQARIRVSGRASHEAGLTRLSELSEMLVALCDYWPADTSGGIPGERAGMTSTGADEPLILSGRWSGAERANNAQNAPAGVLGNDAA